MPTASGGRVLSPGEMCEDIQAETKEWKEDLNVLLICPDCKENPPNLIEEFAAGDTVCGSCGMVLAEHVLDTRSEWRTFSNDEKDGEDPSRIGAAANPLLDGDQLETKIANTGGSRNFTNLARAHQHATRYASNERLQAVYAQIDGYCDIARLPGVVAETAKQIYNAAVKSNVRLVKVKPKETIASCIIIASRQHDQLDANRGVREIEKVVGLQKNAINKVFTAVRDFVKTNQQRISGQSNPAASSGDTGQSGITSPASTITHASAIAALIPRTCQSLGMPSNITLIAEDCARCVVTDGHRNLAGRKPVTIAAAVVYLVSHLMGDGRSLQAICDVMGIATGKVSDVYKDIYQQAMIEHENPELFRKMKYWIQHGGNRSLIPS